MAACALLAGAIFVASFKFALKEVRSDHTRPFEPEIPRAWLCEPGKRQGREWRRGILKQRLINQTQVFQAVFVAVGITSVFAMFSCMAGVVAFLLVSSW